MVDLQTNLQNVMDLQGNLQVNQPEIHSIEASNNTQLPDENLPRQRSSRYLQHQHCGQMWTPERDYNPGILQRVLR